jgi:hypothetical protein
MFLFKNPWQKYEKIGLLLRMEKTARNPILINRKSYRVPITSKKDIAKGRNGESGMIPIFFFSETFYFFCFLVDCSKKLCKFARTIIYQLKISGYEKSITHYF